MSDAHLVGWSDDGWPIVYRDDIDAMGDPGSEQTYGTNSRQAGQLPERREGIMHNTTINTTLASRAGRVLVAVFALGLLLGTAAIATPAHAAGPASRIVNADNSGKDLRANQDFIVTISGYKETAKVRIKVVSGTPVGDEISRHEGRYERWYTFVARNGNYRVTVPVGSLGSEVKDCFSVVLYTSTKRGHHVVGSVSYGNYQSADALNDFVKIKRLR